MKKQYDTVISTANGTPIVGASVTVTNSLTGTTATLYSNNSGTTVAQPLTTDANGYYEFYAANGRYTITITKTSLATRTISDILLYDEQTYLANVKEAPYYATGNGTTDDTAAIQLALSSGVKEVYLPSGTYKITSTLNVPANVSVTGDGIGATIIDGSSVSASALTGGVHIQAASGTLTSIPALSVSPVKGSSTLTFASAPSVVADDVIVLYNATNSSWSAFRTYYREGEYCRVASVSGSVVTLQGPLADAYTAASMTCYKYSSASSCLFQGFTLKGTNSTVSAVHGIQLTKGVDCVFRDVRVYNCSYSQINLSSCVNVEIDNCVCQEDFVNTFSGDYGLIMANCQNIRVHGGYFASSRHGVTMGGADAAGCVPNRYITIDGAYCATSSPTSQALDCHGNAEHIKFLNNNVRGAFSFGGNHIHIIGNTIQAFSPTNTCLYAAELSGLNITIAHNTIDNPSYHTANGSFIDIGGNGQAWGSSSSGGGELLIQNNRLHWGMTTYDASAWHIKITNSGYTGTDRVSIRILNNTLTMASTLPEARGGYGDITVSSGSTSMWDYIEIKGNKFDASGFRIHHAVAASYAAAGVVCEGNTFRKGSQNGCRIQQVRDYIKFRNNTLSEVNYTSLEGISAGAVCSLIEASGNTFFNTCVERQNSAALDMSVGLWYSTMAVAKDNTSFENNEYIGVASNTNFVVGETITGATSGVTAIVYGKRSTTELMIGTTRSGTFTNGENLNGSSSGTSTSTYTGSSVDFTTQNMLSFISDATVYQGGNVHNRLTTNYTNGAIQYPLDANRASTMSADKGNAAFTFDPATVVDTTLLWNTTLTAARAVTLNTAGAWDGLTVRIVRGASATGAFNLNVGTGPLKALTAASTWCEVTYDGSAWVLTASGSL